MLHRHHQMPRITYKTIIIRQIEQLLIAASLFELDSDHDGFEYSWRLEFEDSDEDHEYLVPLEMIEFYETINPFSHRLDIWLLAISSLEAITSLQARYYYRGDCI
jgi:hypothetical protein